MSFEAPTDRTRLREIGYSLQRCGLCAHARFYTDVTRPDRRKRPPEWGFCALHARGPEEPLRIHRSGHCKDGFQVHAPSVDGEGLFYFDEFL